MRLLLARHAESVWNEVRRFQGATDVELSARGRAQARALGRALRGYRLAVAYVSPLARARQTAEIALARTGARIVRRLRFDNASVTVAEPPRLVTLNDTRHLQLEGAEAAPSKPPLSREVARPSPSPGAAPSKPPLSREVARPSPSPSEITP